MTSKMKIFNKLPLLLSLLLLISMRQLQAQIYVDISANGTNDGSSWTNAYTDLQPAIAAAVAQGTAVEIWVARGEYRPTATTDRTISFEMHSNIAMYGGFAGGETSLTERDWKVNRTVLSGDIGVRFTHTDNSEHVLVATDTDNSSILDGFIVKHGFSSTQGGGLLISRINDANSSPLIKNCNFYENFATICGGGIGLNESSSNSNSRTKIYNCIFNSNRSNIKGGAIGSTSVVTNQHIDFEIINCVFSTNVSNSGGNIFSNTGSFIIKNSSFTKNQSLNSDNANLKGSAILIGSGSPEIKNNIIWENYYGSASSNDYSEQIAIVVPNSANPIIQNNLIQGGYGTPADNNIDADPLFEKEPSFVGVYPRTSIIPSGKTRKYYENQWLLEGPTMPDKRYFDIYKDNANNKIYFTGYRIQMLDLNTLVDGRPTSTIYSDLWFSTISQPKNSVSSLTNRIYFTTTRDGIYWIDRTTGVSGKIDPLAGESITYTNVGEEDIVVDNTNNLLYATIRYDGFIYGILELNLSTGTKNWITRTSSPVAIPDVSSGYYWSQNKLFLDEVENILYFSSNGGLWWWDRDDNTTGIINTSGGMPLLAGQPGLPSNQVTHVYIDREENKFYMGTHGGLFVWDRNNNTSKVYDKDNSVLIHNLINQIDKNVEENIIYVACERGGLFTINLSTGEERLYTREEGNEIFPQMPDTDLSSANYDPQEKILYNATFHPNGGAWVWDYNDLVPDYGDLRLKAGSPAIDKGIDAEIPSGITTDAAGQPRFEDFATIGTDAVDLGAYERTYAEDEAPPAVTPVQALNYIVSRTVLAEGVTEDQNLDNFAIKDINKSIQYFDGLGRDLQAVVVQGSPNKHDIVQHTQYDQFGRMANDYLPYSAYMLTGDQKSNGAYKTNPLNNLQAFYDPISMATEVEDVAKDDFYFAKKKFEPSPLNRIAEQGAPGTTWQPNANNENGKTIKFHYLVNAANQVREWTINTTTGLPSTNGHFAANELTLTETIDEEGAQTNEFVDKRGRTVLKEVENLTDEGLVEWLRTYYVYDDFNNLRFVFPPKAINILNHGNYNPADIDDPILKNLAFQYEYDQRQRMIMKKVPGAEPIYMIYDQFDRLVFTQDGNQYVKHDEEWSFTKYDHLNRPVITGTIELQGILVGADRNAKRQDLLNKLTTHYDNGLGANPAIRYESFDASTTFGYTDRSYPLASLTSQKILTVTYYDNYDFRTDNLLGTAANYVFAPELDLLNAEVFDKVKGQVTGSKTKVLGEDKWLNTVTYYDDRYRVIQTITDNYTGGFDRVTSKYDFSGRVIKTKQTHRRGENIFDDLEVRQSFTYDHASRLLNTYHQINNQDSVLMSANKYNEIGELVEKNLHATDIASPQFKQSVDYRYNIRGWLTQINNSALSSAGINADETVMDYFGMQLYYDQKVSGLNYVTDNVWFDPLNLPTNYFNQLLKGLQVKPLIGVGKQVVPDLKNQINVPVLQKTTVVKPGSIKAQLKNAKKKGIGYSDDPKPYFEPISEATFLNVDAATLTASTDNELWLPNNKEKAEYAEDKSAMLTQEIWLETECGTVGSNWTQTNDVAASNNNYMVMSTGTSQTGSAPTATADHISFTFDVTEAGNYKIWGRVYATSANDDSFWVRMDGGTWIKWNNINKNSWLWDDVHNSDAGSAPVNFNLSIGTHTFDIAFREIGAKIDKLYVSNSGTTPSGVGGSAGNCVATTPPATPTGLVVDRTSFGYIKFAWNANPVIVDDYTIERSTDNVNFTNIGTASGNELAYQDNTAAANTTYHYRIIANNHLGSSAASTSLQGSTNMSPGVIDDQLVLYLDARNNDSYPGSGGTWFDLSPSANDATLKSGFYSFSGTDLSFTYTGSQMYTANDIPIAQNEDFSVGFWINPSDNTLPNNVESNNDYGAFFFQVRSGYAGRIEAGVANDNSSKIIYTDLSGTILEENQDQYFVYTYSNNIAKLYKDGQLLISKDVGPMDTDWTKFRLNYAAGIFNAAQVYSKVLTPAEVNHNFLIGCGSGNATVPSDPSSLTATTLSLSQVALSWTDNSNDEIYFQIERSEGGGAYAVIGQADANATSYEDFNLKAETSYSYRISAVNAAGNSNHTSVAQATTQNLPTINIASDALELYLDAGNSSSYNGAGSGLAWNDISGNNNHATLDAGVAKVGDHLHFTDQGFEAAMPALLSAATNFTVGFWMRPDAIGYRNNNLHATGAAFGEGAFFSYNSSPNYRYQTGITATNMYDNYSTYVLNEWAYFVFTYENGTARMYKNGVEYSNSPQAQDPVAVDFESLALSQGYGDFDILQVYSKTLSNAEVFQNYEIHKNRYFTPTAAPQAPTDLVINSVTENQIKITWTDNATSEDKFVIEYAMNETGPFSVLAESIVNVNNFSHDNLSNNQVYFYRVKAENGIGSSDYSNVLSAKTLSGATAAPATPGSLSASVVSFSKIALTWNDIATMEDEYVVERSIDGTNFSLVTTLPFNTTTYDDTGLDPTTTYHYRIKARNTIGDSGYSNQANATTLSMPNFAVVTSGLNLYLDATLSMSYADGNGTWSDLSGSGNDATLDAGVAKVNGRLHFTDQGFEAPLPGFPVGTTNFSVGFWVRADVQGFGYNSVASSNYAPGVGAFYALNDETTRIVTGLENNRFDLYNVYTLNTWVYMVYTYDNGNGRLYKNGALVLGPTAQGNVTAAFETIEFTKGHGDFEVLQVYNRTLTAAEVTQNYNADKDRYFSTSGVPAAPSGLAATANSKSQIDLVWTDNANNEGNYIVEFSTDGGTTYNVLESLSSASQAYSHAGLAAGQTVYYRIAATNSTGISGYSNVVSATTYLEEPTSLVAKPFESFQIDLMWDDNASVETGYEVDRRIGSSGAFTNLARLSANSNTYTNQSLTPETTYEYRVRATGSTINSAYSDTVTVITGLYPPSNVMVTPLTAFELDISWINNTSIATHVIVQRSLSANCDFVATDTLAASATTYQDSGLEPNTTYFYRVQAYNTIHHSSFSNATGAATLPLIVSNPDLDYQAREYYNGNISAVTWQTANAGQEQGYTYTYDPVNRLKGASHVHKIGTATSWNTADAGFSVGNIKYDQNGNIMNLKRQATNDVGTYVMDDLSYTYESGETSNRLLAVADGSGKDDGFKDGNLTATDYTYDDNGNMISDANKEITDINYNILNLPEQIDFANGNRIHFVYDAAGTKLRKEVFEKLDAGGFKRTVTDYMSGIQYTINDHSSAEEAVNRDFVMTPEGRATAEDGLASNSSFNYEYNLTDHLGNVRVTFTTKEETPDEYKATLEDGQGEDAEFLNYDQITKITNTMYNHTPDTEVAGANKSLRLSGATGEVIGLAKSLAVVPGDVVAMEVYAKYFSPTTTDSNVNGILGAVAGAFGVSNPTTPDGQAAYDALSSLFSAGPFLDATDWEDANAPKAFLNYILFDQDYVPYYYGLDQIDITANEDGSDIAHDYLNLSANVTKAGYIYIYLSNENDKLVDVFFDDFKITHTKSPIISADDYYPFGLQISQNNYQRESAVSQKYKYNGFELQSEFGLGLHDYQARYYDGAIGRFINVDPAADLMRRHSTYNYAFDNPVRFTDPDGMMPEDSTDPEDINVVNLARTAFFEVKHSFYNLVFTGIANSTFSAVKLNAEFKVDENGNQTFETDFKPVVRGSGAREAAGAALDVVNIVTAGKNPAGSLLSKTGGKTQITKAAQQLAENKEAGKVGEDFLHQTFGGTQQVSRNTSDGRRVIDNLTEVGTSQESKVGRVSNSSSIKRQVAKDVELLNTSNNGINRVEWHFFSGKTGIGPSKNLIQNLETNNIPYFIH